MKEWFKRLSRGSPLINSSFLCTLSTVPSLFAHLTWPALTAVPFVNSFWLLAILDLSFRANATATVGTCYTSMLLRHVYRNLWLTTASPSALSSQTTIARVQEQTSTART